MLTRSEWLAQLKAETAKLPQEEQQRACAYYDEMFEDKYEQGMTERDIILSFGSPKDAANAIWEEYRESHPETEIKKAGTTPVQPDEEKGSVTACVLIGLVLWPVCAGVSLAGLLTAFASLAVGATSLFEAIHRALTSTENLTSVIGISLIAIGFGLAVLYPVIYGSKKMFFGLKVLLTKIKEGK